MTKSLSMLASVDELHQIDAFKAEFHYWDSWTGARFVRIENPIYNTPAGKNIVPRSICRSDPVTGYWHPL